MKKTATLFGCVCLFAMFSCKKDVTTQMSDLSQSASQKNLSLVTVNGVTTNTDTIPPTNAVDVKTLGAKGDGVTDDTKALQNAINAHTVILLSKGTYIINSTLTMPAGVKIYGVNGAAIKSGSALAASNALLGHGRYIYIGTNGCQIVNVTFLPGSQAFQLGSWGNAVIYVQNSRLSGVTYCKFNFNQPYQHLGVEGVWCDGPGTWQTYIAHNICNTVGIEYAESGACGTICMNNVINNSHSNALSGDGNGSTYCTNVQVCYNTINNAGYNGINDWGLINGTLIRGNVINGSGKSPSEGALGEGIQAVAVNTVVTLNTISDAQAEYIECASTNKRIDSNKIIDTKLLMLGIVVNTTQPAQANATSTVAQIDHNNITGCLDAVEIIGNNPTNVSLTYNTITNPKNVGINIISNASTYTVNMTGNNINLTTPNVQGRNAILSYVTTKTSSQIINLTNNTITYSTSAAGGAGPEKAFSSGTNNVTMIGNKVIGNSITSAAGKEIVAMDNAGVTYTGYTLLNNTFTGCLAYMTGFLTTSISGNSF